MAQQDLNLKSGDSTALLGLLGELQGDGFSPSLAGSFCISNLTSGLTAGLSTAATM